MTVFEAFLLGLLQGLTEFLPVSSSGHLELGHVLLGIRGDNLLFAVVVHGATVLSTLVVFRQDIIAILSGLSALRWNEGTRYFCLLLLSAVPVGLIGLFFRVEIEGLFSGDLRFVGILMLVTASLLAFTHFAGTRTGNIRWYDALIIGVAQAIAVLPGISRSGSTIATGLLLGKGKEEMARFSFLMVILPILGANLLDLMSGEITTSGTIGIVPLCIGFVTAFLSGLMACKWMIGIVKRGRLIYFALYCLVIGLIAIFAA